MTSLQMAKLKSDVVAVIDNRSYIYRYDIYLKQIGKDNVPVRLSVFGKALHFETVGSGTVILKAGGNSVPIENVLYYQTFMIDVTSDYDWEKVLAGFAATLPEYQTKIHNMLLGAE